MIHKDFFRFIENKDRLIDKLNLTDEQKTQLKDFFNKHPNYESKIDWNNKNLTWDDFSGLFDLEYSKSKAKKKGIEGLKEGLDYLILEQNDLYTIYYPLDHKASQTLASTRVAPYTEGKWCISQNSSQWWDDYTNRGIDFFFYFTKTAKYAIDRRTRDEFIDKSLAETSAPMDIFSEQDHEMTIPEFKADQDYKNRADKDKWIELTGKTYKTLKDFDELKVRDPKDWSLEYEGAFYTKDGKTLKNVKPGIKEIKIKEGCEDIKTRAFANSDIESVIMPDSITRTGSQVFYNCTKLKYVKLSRKLYKIYEGMFLNCQNLKQIDLPPDLEAIWTEAFANTGLEEVTLPENMNYLLTGAFSGCRDLKKINLNKKLSYIEIYAFAHSGLETFTLPKNVNVFGACFQDCKNLRSVDLSQNYMLNKIDQTMFKDCINLKQITFPPYLDIIGSSAFWNTGFEDILIPKECSRIEENAFRNCKNLKTLRVSKGVVIHVSAFWDCPKLKNVQFDGPRQRWTVGTYRVFDPTKQSIIGPSWKSKKITVHCTDGIYIDETFSYDEIPYEEYQAQKNVIRKTF